MDRMSFAWAVIAKELEDLRDQLELAKLERDEARDNLLGERSFNYGVERALRRQIHFLRAVQ